MPPARVTLAVMLYLALDLATPIMPGIVPLVGVSPDPVEGWRTRSYTASGPAVGPRHLSPVVPQRERIPRQAPWIASALTLDVVLFCPSFEPSSSASPSSADDD